MFKHWVQEDERGNGAVGGGNPYTDTQELSRIFVAFLEKTTTTTTTTTTCSAWGESCSKDADCCGDMICCEHSTYAQFHTCHYACCFSDKDCETGYKCENYRCVVETTTTTTQTSSCKKTSCEDIDHYCSSYYGECRVKKCYCTGCSKYWECWNAWTGKNCGSYEECRNLYGTNYREASKDYVYLVDPSITSQSACEG